MPPRHPTKRVSTDTPVLTLHPLCSFYVIQPMCSGVFHELRGKSR